MHNFWKFVKFLQNKVIQIFYCLKNQQFLLKYKFLIRYILKSISHRKVIGKGFFKFFLRNFENTRPKSLNTGWIQLIKIAKSDWLKLQVSTIIRWTFCIMSRSHKDLQGFIKSFLKGFRKHNTKILFDSR